MNKHLITGCKLLTNDMLYHLSEYKQIYTGFLGCDSIATLYKEINEVYRKESSVLRIPLQKVYHDPDLNALVLTKCK